MSAMGYSVRLLYLFLKVADVVVMPGVSKYSVSSAIETSAGEVL